MLLSFIEVEKFSDDIPVSNISGNHRLVDVMIHRVCIS